MNDCYTAALARACSTPLALNVVPHPDAASKTKKLTHGAPFPLTALCALPAQARVSEPELTVEFYGSFVRTGYSTRRLLAKSRASTVGGGAEIGVAPGVGPTLTASWASPINGLPVMKDPMRL